MNELDKKLYSLLGDKTLRDGCLIEFESVFNPVGAKKPQILRKKIDSQNWFYGEDVMNAVLEKNYATFGTCMEYPEGINAKIIGHEPTIADLHKVFASLKLRWLQSKYHIELLHAVERMPKIPYDSSLSLLSQSEKTKSLIINLIESYER